MLEIIFIGLICFIGAGDTGRTVSILDVSRGAEVHGHHVQEHRAFLLIPKDYFLEARNWVPLDSDERLYPIDGYELTITGIDEAAPFTIDPTMDCYVPSLTMECPEFGKLRSMTEIKAMSAGMLDIEAGRLSACRPAPDKAVSSIWTVPTKGNVIIAAKKNGETRSLTLKPDARIEIVNNPVDKELVENHFIAYYRLSETGNACTNIPFTRFKPRCTGGGEKCPLGIGLTTAACSNSVYP